MSTETDNQRLREVLEDAKNVIGNLIASIEGHHATSNCDDSGMWALLGNYYKRLSAIRAALEETAIAAAKEKE